MAARETANFKDLSEDNWPHQLSFLELLNLVIMTLNSARKPDTSPDAQRLVDNIYRNMSIAEKWQILAQMWNDAKRLHAAGVRMRQPEITPEEIHQSWLAQILDPADLARISKTTCDG